MGAGSGWFSSERYAAQRDEALWQFGQMLRIWRLRNHWTQYTASNWGKEAGFPSLAAGNWSNIEHGKAGNLQPSTFFKLAELNQRVAAADWSGVRSRNLMDQLDGSQPLCGDDGKLWGPCELWSCSVGLLPPPKALQPDLLTSAPAISQGETHNLCSKWRQQLRELVLEHDLDPSEALMDVAKHVDAQHRRRLRQVLGMDGRDYSATELQELWVNGWLPEKAIQQWAGQLLP